MADIPASTWSQTDGSNTTAAPDGAPEGMAPSGVNDVMRMMMGAIKRWYAWLVPATTGGTTTAYTLSYSVAPAALVDGMTHVVLFNATNGTAPTLNINSLGAKPLYKYSNGAWGAVASGDITANMVCVVSYNSGEGSYRILGSASTGIGAAFLAVAQTFTALQTFTGGITATSGTNTIALATGSSAVTQTQATNTTTLATTAYVDRVAIQQVVKTVTGAVATGTTTIPSDDTIPQNTEGDEYMTRSITPKSATSTLRIDVVWNGTNSAGAGQVVALFQDTTANALAVASQAPSVAGAPITIPLTYFMTSGTTSSTTFKVRSGPTSAGTTTFNGTAGGRLYSGTLASSITITEIGV